jgi:hypothetical protein
VRRVHGFAAHPWAVGSFIISHSLLADERRGPDSLPIDIAGDKPGAEALSGLARAFFYAGARALLVSH